MSEPPITVRAFWDDGTNNTNPTRVVIHATCPNVGYPRASGSGTALGTARYFSTSAAGGSAHYICDPGNEEHCVPDAHVARHAPPNAHSLGIEINAEGGDYPKSYTRAEWLSPQVWPAVVRAAARTRELCERFGIPTVKLNPTDLLAGKHGICGHIDVSQAWHQTTHSDPGPEFPWVEFMDAVVAKPAPVVVVVSPPEEDTLFIKCQGLDPKNPTAVATALLAGPIFVGITAGEVTSADDAIRKGATVLNVLPATWHALDMRSHALCDMPLHVVVDK